MRRYITLSSALLALLIGLAAVAAQPLPTAAQGASRHFPQTGYTVSEPFLSYWDRHGGLAIFGYPIGPLQDYTDPVSGLTVQAQWFERARFELHPENPQPYRVLLGRLGAVAAEPMRAAPPFQPIAPVSGPDLAFFPETGHSVGGDFLRFWSQRGGLAIFGYPLSEPFAERSATDGQTYSVQYFERARFELHPENSEPYRVLLGLLGVQQRAAPPDAGIAQILVNDGNFTARLVPGQTVALGADARELTVTVSYARDISGQPFDVQIEQLGGPAPWQVAPAGRANTRDSYSFALRGAAGSPDYLRVAVSYGAGNPAIYFGVQLTGQLPGDPALRADWSAEGLIPSYYNAINRREYQRAYSYWEQPGRPNSAPADFSAFAQGYANTARVDVTTGSLTSDAGAGNIYVAVPTVLQVTLAAPQGGSDRQAYFGCYLLHGVNAPVGDTTPPYPLEIRSANMVPAPASANPAELMRQAQDLARAGQCG